MCACLLWQAALQSNNRLSSSPHPHVAGGTLEEGVLQTAANPSRPVLKVVTHFAQAHVVALLRAGVEGKREISSGLLRRFWLHKPSILL